MKILLGCLLIGAALAFPSQPKAGSCGYDSCPKAQAGKLNVHLVPHTHDDVGWLKTVDQYYYGSKNNIQNAGVQYILDSVVSALLQNPERKFIYVETAFFWKWWVEQTPELQAQVKDLVNSGRLEFIGGAWSMNDEATTHYISTIDNFSYGLRKLNETFGTCGQPRVGWQIDPFGHSREQASLMAQYYFDGLFFARLDYQDKSNRLSKKTMEMVWETSPSLGESTDIFTHALNNHYSTPGGFCWDAFCGDDPIIDNPNIPDYNVDDRVNSFLDFARGQAERYQSNNIIVLFGDDFQYKSALKNFKNIDKLISNSDIFTLGLYNNYASPPGFCFDILCSDEPFIDDPNTADYNVQQKVDDFISYVKNQSTGYRTNNVILTMGEDFHYQDANHHFKNLDKLISENCFCFCAGDVVDLYTSAFYDFYLSPNGFCFDIECGDLPIIDNPKSFDYNVPDRVDEFLKFINKQRKHFATNNILIPMGGDFNYQDALSQYKNTDKLIRYVNERQASGSDVNVFYSTPSCYLKSVNEANINWPTKQDDFFPYASNAHSYWTGYFTSRPTLKYFERQGNNILQATKQLASVSKVNSNGLEELQSVMGIMQHHDAVAGTEKQAVAEDYARMLDKAVRSSETILSSAVNTLMKKAANAPPLVFDTCRLRNISQCALTEEKNTFLVTVYNPLSRVVDYYVRLPVQNTTYTVRAPGGAVIASQLLPIPEQLTRLPGRTATTTVELVFNASALPPLGYRSYYITKGSVKVDTSSRVWVPEENEAVSIGDKMTTITLDPKTKLLKSITSRAETYDVAQSLQYYTGVLGNNSNENFRSSGAYIFRPERTEPNKIADEAQTVVIQGDVVHEVHQVFSNWASQIVRHYNNQPVVEFEWLVGPIPVDDNVGKEIISKFTTTIPTDSTFYTDSSGREVLERKLNYRPTWNLEVNEPVAGNYYPIVTHINFINATAGLAIVTDRAQGGASLQDGELEVMVHRRLLHDDAFGVGEAINEQAFGSGLVARGRHFVLIGDANAVSSKQIRLLETRKVLDGLVFITDATGQTQANIETNYNTEYSALTAALPDQVQIVTLEPWKDGTLLLRLENIFTVEEDPTVVSVDITKLFKNIQVVSARETTLAGNKWLDEATRLQWQKDSNEVPTSRPKAKAPLALDNVELAPKQIRTLVLTVA